MRSSLKPLVLALGLALAAELASAAGFGKINVSSALGQPLAAEIDLLNVSPDDLVGMQVRLASTEAFREANVDYSPALSSVRFSIEKRANGQSYIRVAGSQPISEPALHLLVEVTWPSGRLLRDYPVLLNPAGYSQDRQADSGPRVAPTPPEVPVKPAAAAAPAAAAPTPTPPAAAAAKPVPNPAAAKAPAARPAATAARAPVPAAGASAGAGADYTVKPGDTVRQLAYGNKPGNASLEQTMLAMFEANRSAFINDSIHRIRAGKRIHMPTESEATAIPADEASRRVNLLASDFEAYRQRVAEAADAKPTTANPAKAPVTGKLGAQTADVAHPAKPGSDVVQVSRSATAAAAGAAGDGKTAEGKGLAQRRTAADDKANRLEEESIARENQLKEARERVALLENNLAQMRSLANKKPEAGDAAAAAATTPAAANPPASATPAKPVPTSEAPKPAEPATPAAPVAQAPKPAPTPAAKPATETSFVDEILAQLQDNPLAVGGGVLSGLLVGWLGLNAVRRRRDRTQDLFAPTTTSPEPITVDAVTTDKGSALLDSSTGNYATEFERVVPDQQVDEVDPVAEADVYIAYGRDVQAEEILKEAMAKDPDRTEILMKLLEIYAQRKNREEYAQHALQLRDRVGTSHPLWSAAMAMGYEIDPGNALYHGAGEEYAAPTLTHAAPAALDLDLGEPGITPAVSVGDPLALSQPDLSLAPAAGAHAAGPHGLLDVGESAARGGSPALPDFQLGDDAEAAETLRALSAISADSLRTGEAGRGDAAAGSWPSLPEVAAVGGGLSLAASNEPITLPEGGDPFTIDFDLGEGAAKPANASLDHGNAALDLGKIDLDLKPEAHPASNAPVLTLVSNPAPVQPVPGESHAEPRSFADIDLELKGAAPAPAAPSEQGSQWHNVATKLDLARAYLEIGDKDGAREILREVSAEGDEAQRREAERLAVQI